MPPASNPQATSAASPRPAGKGARGAKATQAAATREHLIDTAIDVLHARSYHGATVFEVAKAAGVTHGALQHHFGSKAVMMMQVTDAIVRASGADGVAWPDASGTLEQRCQALVQALWSRVYEPPRFLAAWAVYFGSAGESELRSHVAKQRRDLTRNLHQRFVQVLPELAGHPDSQTLVQLVLTTLRGLAMTRLFGADPVAEAAQRALLAQMLVHHGTTTSPSPSPSKPLRRRREA
jgi:AcrR family transcriptional regulator